MDDREFWLIMRQSLIQMAESAPDLSSKRALLRMVAAIEKRYEIPKMRLVREKTRA